MKKKVCIIYTGGTIGMVDTGNGYAPKSEYLKNVLESIPELHGGETPDWELIEFDELLDSSNISFSHGARSPRSLRKTMLLMMAL